MSSVLGLDISTSCTGWCVLGHEGGLIEMGYIPLAKLQGPFEKAARVFEELTDICSRYNIENIFIEENLQAFRPGLSSAKTLLSLARFNGIVSFICYQIFNFEPMFINVNAARKSLGIKIERERKCGISTKDQVRSWVDNALSDVEYPWPIKILKHGPRKGKHIFDPVCYDIADAFVIAQAGLKLPN